jgi:uncharacterized membrane protein YphA (DoxX/SURF4 family)
LVKAIMSSRGDEFIDLARSIGGASTPMASHILEASEWKPIRKARQPFPDLVRLFGVAVELSGGLAVLFGFQARIAAAGLAVWCIVTALVGHTNFADADTQIQFMKNVAMSGGFIFIAAFGPGAYALARAWRRPPAIS